MPDCRRPRRGYNLPLSPFVHARQKFARQPHIEPRFIHSDNVRHFTLDVKRPMMYDIRRPDTEARLGKHGQGLIDQGESMAQDNVTSPIPTPVVRTSAGLRNALFDELDGIRNGTSNTARANAVAKLAGQLVETVRMELEVHRHMSKMPKGEPQPAIAIPAVPLA